MIRELPTEDKQGSDGDHAQIQYRQERYDSEGNLSSVEVSFRYGTKDGSGNFVPHPLESGGRQFVLDDVQGFKEDGFSGEAPGKKGDPVGQAMKAVADWADKNHLWSEA